MADEKRTVVVVVYVTASMKAAIEAAALEDHRSVSDWALGLFRAATNRHQSRLRT